MEFISPEIGKALFERIGEIVAETPLKTRERFPKYRLLLEDLFKELTKDENRYFSSLAARSEYIFSIYRNTPLFIKKNTDGLRRVANKVVHQSDFQPTEIEHAYSLRNLCTILSYFSRQAIPPQYKTHYESIIKNRIDSDGLSVQPKPVAQEAYSFRAVVTEVVPSNDFPKCRILMCVADDLGEIVLKLWNNLDERGFGSDLTQFADVVFPFATIYVTDVKKHTDKENEYYAQSHSLIVLEPDYLLEAKALSECVQQNGQNPYIHLLGRLIKEA